jgi:hypothetical protein
LIFLIFQIRPMVLIRKCFALRDNGKPGQSPVANPVFASFVWGPAAVAAGAFPALQVQPEAAAAVAVVVPSIPPCFTLRCCLTYCIAMWGKVARAALPVLRVVPGPCQVS